MALIEVMITGWFMNLLAQSQPAYTQDTLPNDLHNDLSDDLHNDLLDNVDEITIANLSRNRLNKAFLMLLSVSLKLTIETPYNTLTSYNIKQTKYKIRHTVFSHFMCFYPPISINFLFEKWQHSKSLADFYLLGKSDTIVIEAIEAMKALS